MLALFEKLLVIAFLLTFNKLKQLKTLIFTF